MDKDTIYRQAAIEALREEFKRTPTTAIRAMHRIEQLPPAQPEPIWGLPVSADRPLADMEIVSRLRDSQKQIPGGSYAIDRANEIIEAVAERRTDE